jgi:hypothetical protein
MENMQKKLKLIDDYLKQTTEGKEGKLSKKQIEEINKITQNKIGKGIKPIICDTLFGIEFLSLSDASESLGINKGNICEVLKGNRIHIKGLTFRYK